MYCFLIFSFICGSSRISFTSLYLFLEEPTLLVALLFLLIQTSLVLLFFSLEEPDDIYITLRVSEYMFSFVAYHLISKLPIHIYFIQTLRKHSLAIVMRCSLRQLQSILFVFVLQCNRKFANNGWGATSARASVDQFLAGGLYSFSDCNLGESIHMGSGDSTRSNFFKTFPSHLVSVLMWMSTNSHGMAFFAYMFSRCVWATTPSFDAAWDQMSFS